MFKKLGVQAYSFRSYYDGENACEATLDKAFRTIKACGYDEIQTAGFGRLSIEQYAKLAHDNGIAIVGTHYDWNEMLNDTDEAMRKHTEILDCRIMGIGGMPLEARNDLDALKKFIEDFNTVGQRVHKHGFKLTYHNHHFEFIKIDGKKTIMDYLYEGLDPETTSFCMDTHWVQRGGGNPTTWLKKLSGRIDILHLKDMAMERTEKGWEPYITEIGNGNIDFDSIVEAAPACGVTYYCVEQDICPGDPLDSLKQSADYIKAHYMG